jgi:glycosyltransferase involved in cell wall biosynthesis
VAASFAIVANGLLMDGPAQALRDYLVARDARVLTILHPLTPEEGHGHVVTDHSRGGVVAERTVRLPVGPPASYAVDPFVPLLPASVDVWFGFNPLACARGIAARKQRRARSAVLWSVDFTPDRFGAKSPLTKLYDRVDRFCCRRADARVELSDAALRARNERHGLAGEDAAPAHVVPMGAWLDRVPTTAADGVARRRIVFLGHLVEGKGAELVVEAVRILSARGEEITADLVGGGPQEDAIRSTVAELGLGDRIRIHGFLPDHREVERILAESSVALAPYAPAPETHTRWADPGKLKAYLAAGLPILLTDVPPNARELEREAGASVVAYDPKAIADAVAATIADADEWRRRRDAALAYARRFDWNVLLGDALSELGFAR